jgi:CubicO group peptidase (beta-lactamase class C family)
MLNRREFIPVLPAAVSMGRLKAMSLKKDHLEQAAALISKSTDSGEVSAASLYVRQGDLLFKRAFGRAHDPDDVFLLASITKPMTAIGVMILADRGQLALSDPVHKYIPEFAGGDRQLVTIRHLLTHTSGLPDQLAENVELRKRHAGLKEFVAATCRTPLLFKPGTEVKYQSMGLLLATEIAERIIKRPFREFLRDELFRPAGMTKTSLGLGGRKISDTMLCQAQSAPGLYGGGDSTQSWNWNSQYWRDLGAPWGGAHSTASDVARMLTMFLKPDGRILKRETAAAMITNQTSGLNEPRGIGWMLKPGEFGSKCSPRTFGHYGATGTVAWADPQTELVCVLLTTKPADQSRSHVLGPVSDAVSASAI